MTEITTRPATPADRDFVWQLNALCYRDVVTRQFGAWDPVWQEANFEKKWSSQDFTIILLGGTPVGVFAVALQDGVLFLNELLIRPGNQNQGIGTAMLKGLMSRSDASIRLQVLKENAAVSLYQRLGFKVYNTTETHNQLEWRG